MGAHGAPCGPMELPWSSMKPHVAPWGLRVGPMGAIVLAIRMIILMVYCRPAHRFEIGVVWWPPEFKQLF